MPKLADLHIHTYLSDGTFSPQKVVRYSKARGLDAIAITDHDCCGGITPAIMATKDLDMEVIPGVELTAELDEAEIHILGYLIDWQDDSFVKKLNEITMTRKARAIEILQKLRGHGVDISERELFELSGPGSVGRLHIANLLFRKGFVSSPSEAFTKYIGDHKSCYVKKFKLSPEQAVDIIKGVGGVAVLAHPKTIYIKDRPIEDIIKELAGEGVQGIEVYHSDHKRSDEERYMALAEKYHLLITGGSDCHGLGKKEILIGKVKIPYELVEKMKEKSRQNQHE